MVLLCNIFCQCFSVTIFFLIHDYNTHQVRCYHLFIVEITVESVNLIQMSKQNRKLFPHDGEQLGFYKKVHQNTEQKEGCSCNLYITRNEEFQFI